MYLFFSVQLVARCGVGCSASGVVVFDVLVD